MSKLILHLCKEILYLAEAQKEAVLEEKFDEVIELQEKRQRIMKRVQDFDDFESSYGHFDMSEEKDARLKEENSRQMKIIVRKILSVDREIEAIVHRELDSLVGKMETVQKLRKAFCQGAGIPRSGRKLHVNA